MLNVCMDRTDKRVCPVDVGHLKSLFVCYMYHCIWIRFLVKALRDAQMQCFVLSRANSIEMLTSTAVLKIIEEPPK